MISETKSKMAKAQGKREAQELMAFWDMRRAVRIAADWLKEHDKYRAEQLMLMGEKAEKRWQDAGEQYDKTLEEVLL